MKQYCHESDIVLTADNGVLYEAKILRVENLGANFKYFIHYQGWARKFDCWIDEQFVTFKHDEKKIEKITQGFAGVTIKTSKKSKKDAALDEQADDSKSKMFKIEILADNCNSATLATVTDGEESLKNSLKRKRENLEAEAIKKNRRRLASLDLVDEDDEYYVSKLAIPYNLKKHLVDEWGLITRTPGRLLRLPKPVDMTVEAVVKDFLEYKIQKLDQDKVQIEAYKALFEGLQFHFDKALPTILLYRQEREQFDALISAPISPSGIKRRRTPSQIYGAEHLLRFFARMPRLLSNVFLPANEVNQILLKLVDFLKFLGKTSSKCIDIANYVAIDQAKEKQCDALGKS